MRECQAEMAFRERHAWTCAVYRQGTAPEGLRGQARERFGAAGEADETAEILAVYGTPEKRRDYAVWTARRVYDEARKAAHAGYVAAGGSVEALASPRDQRGEPAYDALVSAVQDAAAVFAAARDEAGAAFRLESARV